MVYISTDCADDLKLLSSELVRFEEPSVETYSPCPSILSHKHKWFVGSKAGCSCTFRHLCRESVNLGFGAPEDWYPEEQDEIDATQQLYCILERLVKRGYEVEVLDCWSGDEENDVVSIDVLVETLGPDHFRLFEGHIFTVKSGSGNRPQQNNSGTSGS